MKLLDDKMNWLIPLAIAIIGWLAWISYDYGQTKAKFEHKMIAIEKNADLLRELCCSEIKPAERKLLYPEAKK